MAFSLVSRAILRVPAIVFSRVETDLCRQMRRLTISTEPPPPPPPQERSFHLQLATLTSIGIASSVLFTWMMNLRDEYTSEKKLKRLDVQKELFDIVQVHKVLFTPTQMVRILLFLEDAHKKDPAAVILQYRDFAALVADILKNSLKELSVEELFRVSISLRYLLGTNPFQEYVSKIMPPFESKNHLTAHLPPFVKKTCFNGSRELFVHENLVIGKHTQLIGDGWKTYLLAYDETSGQFAWGRVLDGSQKDARKLSSCSMSGAGIVLSYAHKGEVYLLDPATGQEKHFVVPMPHKNVYVTKSGFCYVERANTLSGGQLDAGTWQQAFEISMPKGVAKQIGDFLYANNFLIDHAGLQVYVGQYGQLKEMQGKIYAIHSGILRIWDNVEALLQEDPLQELLVGDMQLQNVCEDGTLVCTERATYYFVEARTGGRVEVFEKSYQTDVFIDTKGKAIWSFDRYTRKLWKHVPGECVGAPGKQILLDTPLIHATDKTAYFM